MYRSVLLVEDDATFRCVLTAALRKRGHRVLEAATAAQAIRGLGIEQPDLLLIDVNLPDGTGWAVARAAQAHGGPVPTVAMSAAPVSREHLHELDVLAFFPKPFPIAELLDLLAAGPSSARAVGRAAQPPPNPGTRRRPGSDRSIRSSEGGSAELRRCLVHLRAAGAALAAAPPGTLTAISVSSHLSGQLGERRILRALAEEIADRHGLDVSFTPSDGGGVTIRFCHPAAITPGAPRAIGCAARRLRRAMRWR